MQQFRRWLVWLLLAAVCGSAVDNPVQAYYGWGHRNYRSGRGYNRYGNRMASMQRASAAMNAAQGRAYAAQTALAQQTRRVKQKAEASSGLVAAKSDHAQSERDYQASRMTVIASLKANNPEFAQLQQQASSLRNKIAAMARSGNTNGTEFKSLENQLRTKARRIETIENEAIGGDSALKDINGRQAAAHTAEVAASKEVAKAVASDPAVQAAQRQLAMANQQAALAANRYTSTMMGGYNSGSYGYHRGYRHRGYGYGGYGYGGYRYRGGSYVRHVHYVHHRRR